MPDLKTMPIEKLTSLWRFVLWGFARPVAIAVVCVTARLAVGDTVTGFAVLLALAILGFVRVVAPWIVAPVQEWADEVGRRADA